MQPYMGSLLGVGPAPAISVVHALPAVTLSALPPAWGGAAAEGAPPGAAIGAWVYLMPMTLQQDAGRPDVAAPKPAQQAPGVPAPAAEPVGERRPREAAQQAEGSPACVRGQVWALAQDAVGSRLVQRALEEAEDDRARAALADELRGHVVQALRCPHANHVLQKCIASLRPQALQFVVDEITTPDVSQVLQVARHKYGCRILQRLLEHGQKEQIREVVEELGRSAVALSKHAYANFVVQHLFEYLAGEQRSVLVRALERHAKALGKDDHGRAVLSAALAHITSDERLLLAHAILREQGLLVRMARTRQGHAAVRSVLEALGGQERLEARRQLLEGVAKLRLSRYGRMVLAYLL